MNQLFIILFLSLMVIYPSKGVSGKREELTKQIILIGNEESDSVQLKMIRDLINEGDLLLSHKKDAEILSTLNPQQLIKNFS